MAYGCYSEVYYAEHLEIRTAIKIGETTNARRRSNQLLQEDYLILQSLDIGGGECERLFVESFLRMKILKTQKARRIRKDYFNCADLDTVEFIKSHFQEWVMEAIITMREM